MGHVPPEITASHKRRLAVIYTRQSTRYQVTNNVGSAEFQLNQADLAREWGWPDELIRVVGDPGVSGTATEHRQCYQELLEDVRAGKVGAIFVSNFDRANRNLKDFLELQEPCRAQDTLFVEGGRVLNFNDCRDRLVSTLLAQLAEFDNDVRSERFMNSKIAMIGKRKAVSLPPTGYVFAGGEWELDDPAVQAPVRAVFDGFLQELSIVRTVKRLNDHHIMLLLRTRHLIRRVQPTACLVRRVLTNPNYTGDYFFGRRKTDRSKGKARKGQWRTRAAHPNELRVIRDHHDPYVSRENFELIQHLLAANAPWKSRHHAGKGTALLQGIVRCRQHRGHAMVVGYKARRRDGGETHTYLCLGDVGSGRRICGRIPGALLDAAVVEAVVEKWQPPEIEALRHEWRTARAEAMSDERRKQRELTRLQELVQDLDARCKQVAPENYHVKNLREAELEAAIRDKKRAEEAARADQKAPSPLDFLDEAAFEEAKELCANLRELLELPTTTPLDRKQILRTLIDQIAVQSRDLVKVKAEIVWSDGTAPTPIETKLARQGHAIIAHLNAEGVPVPEITRRLNEAEIKTMKGRSWTQHAVWMTIRRMAERANTKSSQRTGRWARGPRPELYVERMSPSVDIVPSDHDQSDGNHTGSVNESQLIRKDKA